MGAQNLSHLDSVRSDLNFHFDPPKVCIPTRAATMRKFGSHASGFPTKPAALKSTDSSRALRPRCHRCVVSRLAVHGYNTGRCLRGGQVSHRQIL